jgi:outer membrane protein insertion porin family
MPSRQAPILLLFAVAVICVLPQRAAAQNFLPKTIHFEGVPEYSDQELLAATGLKKGVALTTSDLNDRAKQLMDSGVFSSVSFKFDGQDLVFTLTPSTSLYPIHLENLPLDSGKDLDTKLHESVPLYHGKVPAEGGVTDGVRSALEKALAGQGIQATVTAVADARDGAGSVVHFSIATPSVLVGAIRLKDASTQLEPGALDILTKLTGSPFDSVGSARQIATYLGNYYHDKGYLEAAIDATAQNAGMVEGVISIPFEITVQPGNQYRLAAVRLAPDLVVSQADFDRQAKLRPGDIADGQHVIENWQFISRQYHNHGYMKASVHPSPTFDRANRTVTFDVTADSGPVYKMGALSIENVSDDLRTTMMAAWKMPAGAIFNEGAIMSFYAIDKTVNSTLYRVFAAAACAYTMHLNEENRTVDVILRLDRKR